MNKSATEDSQKRDIIEKVLTVWQQNPHLRLGQLFINIFENPTDNHTVYKLFSMEDYDLVDKLFEKFSNNHTTFVRNKSSRPPSK